MIGQVMDHINNHFVYANDVDSYEIVTDGIVGDFGQTYLVGMYIWIVNSFLNDGVYKITDVQSNKLVLDTTDGNLIAENTGDLICVFNLKPPKAFLAIVSDIETWESNNSGKAGLASETIDSYSISFGTGSDGNVSNTWQTAFSAKLRPYRQMFETAFRRYDINTKSGGY